MSLSSVTKAEMRQFSPTLRFLHKTAGKSDFQADFPAQTSLCGTIGGANQREDAFSGSELSVGGNPRIWHKATGVVGAKICNFMAEDRN